MGRAKRKSNVVCRFCGEEAPPGEHSHWDHSHPAQCPFVTDRVPSLNGVHVGDLWQNCHTKGISRVEEIRLGGVGVQVDREPSLVMVEVWSPPEVKEGELQLEDGAMPSLEELATCEPDEHAWFHEHPLWSLAEHNDPLTRPGEYPVPWEMEERRGGYVSRSVVDEWRGPAYRGGAKEDRVPDAAYWHAFHHVEGYGIKWEMTNVLWQVEKDADPELLPAQAPERPRRPECPKHGPWSRATQATCPGCEEEERELARVREAEPELEQTALF